MENRAKKKLTKKRKKINVNNIFELVHEKNQLREKNREILAEKKNVF